MFFCLFSPFLPKLDLFQTSYHLLQLSSTATAFPKEVMEHVTNLSFPAYKCGNFAVIHPHRKGKRCLNM